MELIIDPVLSPDTSGQTQMERDARTRSGVVGIASDRMAVAGPASSSAILLWMQCMTD